MNNKLHYKAYSERKSLSETCHSILSDGLVFLYSLSLFQKGNLKRANQHLLYYIKRGKKPSINRFGTIPDDLDFRVHSIAFVDTIEIENSHKFRKGLLGVLSKHKGYTLSGRPDENIDRAFGKFDHDYKTYSYSKIYDSNTRDSKGLDLIDGISYEYVKGSESHFVMIYKVFPSTKFNNLFMEAFKKDEEETLRINFNTWRTMLRKHKLVSSIGHTYVNADYWVEKVLNEINFQLKSRVLGNLKQGLFLSNKHLLFPSIITYEYGKSAFDAYKNGVMWRLGINDDKHYSKGDVIFAMRNANFNKTPAPSMEIFLPIKLKDDTKSPIENSLISTAHLSEEYVQSLAPHWLLINVAEYNKKTIIELRKRVFLFIRENKTSLFLKSTLLLKNKLIVNWISFERIRKDFSADFFGDNLKRNGIPEALNTPFSRHIAPSEIKSDLVGYGKAVSADIKKTFEELLELFNHLSEDNSLRANMRLQKLLFYIAIASIVLTIYSSNAIWFNGWIAYFLRTVLGFEFSNAPG